MANRSEIKKIIIDERAAGRLRAGHVWVYASDVLNDASAAPGSLVHVVNTKGKLQGSAIYSSSSQLKLRLMSREEIGSEAELMTLVRQRLAEAVAYRQRVVRDSNACRLVFSEADGLPGLIVDRYDQIVALQILTQAWDRPERREAIVAALGELTGAGNIVERVDARIRELEQLPARESGSILGQQTATVFTMNSVQFHYDALSGQKTGAFLDQRENYAAAAAYARGQALDVCTYQGGFALHLARVCDQVTALDSSREALEVAEQNEKLNAAANKHEIEWIEANAFDLLRDYADAGRQYDVIVLDPPAFAKSKKNLAAAMRGYKELNLRALKMLRPGGTLVTCSCSFAVGEADFLEMLASAAVDAHRSVKITETRAQAKDHPILPGVPETHYLKCFIAVVS
ncbi:MAG: class I SAM-dependent rRNA methyltransferase [Acidobacteriia bacterium]|nr:class I SAM-dependent rRNA methyltransferase [Terriglobia bacterium]